MSDTLFRKEVLDRKYKDELGDIVLSQPVSFSVLTIGLFIFASLVLILLSIGTYERKASVQGFLEPTTGLVLVHARDSGTVTKLFVEDGGVVKANDPLISISTTRSSDELQDVDGALIIELENTLKIIETKIDSVDQHSKLEDSRLNATIVGLKRELVQIDSNIVTSKKQYSASQKQINNLKNLRKKGHLSEGDYQKELQKHLDNELKLKTLEADKVLKENNLEQAKFDLLQLPLKTATQLADLNKSKSEIKRSSINQKSLRDYTVYAPSDGKITALQAHTGRFLTTGHSLMAVLPVEAEFEAKLLVPTHSIGFVEEGQKVKIRYTAFPYQRFGVYEGVVSNVASAVISPEGLPLKIPSNEQVYTVTVKLESQNVQAYGKELSLQSGMTLEADIVLDELSLLDWLLDPLYQLTGRN